MSSPGVDTWVDLHDALGSSNFRAEIGGASTERCAALSTQLVASR